MKDWKLVNKEHGWVFNLSLCSCTMLCRTNGKYSHVDIVAMFSYADETLVYLHAFQLKIQNSLVIDNYCICLMSCHFQNGWITKLYSKLFFMKDFQNNGTLAQFLFWWMGVAIFPVFYPSSEWISAIVFSLHTMTYSSFWRNENRP